jgi:hypothetical protein
MQPCEQEQLSSHVVVFRATPGFESDARFTREADQQDGRRLANDDDRGRTVQMIRSSPGLSSRR